MRGNKRNKSKKTRQVTQHPYVNNYVPKPFQTGTYRAILILILLLVLGPSLLALILK